MKGRISDDGIRFEEEGVGIVVSGVSVKLIEVKYTFLVLWNNAVLSLM